MLVDIPDPAWTTSERARASFRLAVRLTACFVALLWAIELVDGALGLELGRFGVRPREIAGLPGILLAPLLHGGLAHLATNTVPLLVLAAGMLYLYPASSFKVIPAVYLGPGVAVWLLAKPSSVHVGASGLVYGLFTYIFIAGVIRRDRRAIAATLLVAFLYGSLVWGVFPHRPGVSWETHLAGVLIALALAVALRRLDVPPRKRYEWEGEAGEG